MTTPDPIRRRTCRLPVIPLLLAAALLSATPVWAAAPGDLQLPEPADQQDTKDAADEQAIKRFHAAAEAGDVERLREMLPAFVPIVPPMLEALRKEGNAPLANRALSIDTVNAKGDTALDLAFQGDHVPAFRLLLSAGANLRYLRKKGFDAIHRAPMHRRPGCLAVLLDAGVDVDKRDWAGSTPLYWAGRGDDLKSAKLLIAKGADVNAAADDGTTPLFGAVTDNSIGVAKYLIEQGADVNHMTNRGNTPLHSAASGGLKDFVVLLLEKGADPRIPNSHGNTPLDAAKTKKHAELVKLLEDHVAKQPDMPAELPRSLLIAVAKDDLRGAEALLHLGMNANQTISNGQTPLHAAVSADMVKLLVKHDADVNARDKGGATPLALAARTKREDVVRELLNAKADPNLPDNDGYAPLHRAGTAAIGKLLIEGGADLMALGGEDNTPLHFVGSDVELARVLIDAGAEVDAVNARNRTPLQVAAYINSRKRYDVMKLLLESGADPNREDENGQTPVHRMLDLYHPRKAKLLLEFGAKNDIFVASLIGDTQFIEAELKRDPSLVRTHDPSGNTALGVAAAANQIEVVKLLLDAGAPVDIRDNYGDTPLAKAAMRGKVDVMRLLIDRGAAVNASNGFGGSPLMSAAFFGSHRAVDLLLKKGAHPDIARNTGKTALHMAAERDHDRVVTLLLEHGASAGQRDRHGLTARELAEKSNAKKSLAAFEKFEQKQDEDQAKEPQSQPVDQS